MLTFELYGGLLRQLAGLEAVAVALRVTCLHLTVHGVNYLLKIVHVKIVFVIERRSIVYNHHIII